MPCDIIRLLPNAFMEGLGEVERKLLSEMVIGYHRDKIGIIGRTEMTKKCQETNSILLG